MQGKNLLHSICGTLPEKGNMRMLDFTKLSQKEKVVLLYKDGVYIGKCRHGKAMAVLYQIEGFYVEVFYRTYRREIDRIGCFSDTAKLDPYLAGMDVEDFVV